MIPFFISSKFREHSYISVKFAENISDVCLVYIVSYIPFNESNCLTITACLD